MIDCEEEEGVVGDGIVSVVSVVEARMEYGFVEVGIVLWGLSFVFWCVLGWTGQGNKGRVAVAFGLGWAG